MFHLTIIIPCYNEAARFPKEQFVNYIQNHSNVCFVFVNDGSRDGTLEMLINLCTSPQLQYLNLAENGGKAEAVRRGMIYALENIECNYIGFWDADLATPLYEIDHFGSLIRHQNFDIVTGLRLKRLGTAVERKPLRHYLGRCFATTASIVLDIPVYDTQCGAKLYKKEVVQNLFQEKFITKWLFDIEILARYIRQYGKEAAIRKVYEYPLCQWCDAKGSHLKFKDFFKAPMELLKIKMKYL